MASFVSNIIQPFVLCCLWSHFGCFREVEDLPGHGNELLLAILPPHHRGPDLQNPRVAVGYAWHLCSRGIWQYHSLLAARITQMADC